MTQIRGKGGGIKAHACHKSVVLLRWRNNMKFFILCMYIPDKWSMKSILSYRHKIFTQNGLRGALQKMLTTFFGIFGTPFLPYLLNHSSYRTEIFTQNRVRGALQKMSTTRVSKIWFTISKKLKTDFRTIFCHIF